jgi:hypothetical protein
MNIRKIAAVGSIVAGAALAFAPLAAADDDLTTTFDSEIASLNSLFESQVAVAGDTADITLGGTGVLDTILPADAPDAAPLTTLDYELYGPLADLLNGPFDDAPGAQDLFDGALVEFDDAYNALVSFALGDDVISPSDLIGAADISTALGGATDATMFGTFLDTGISDLTAWFSGVVIPG